MMEFAPREDPTVLETARLHLRRYDVDDLPALHAIFSDPATMTFWPAPFDAAQTDAWLQRAFLNYHVFGLGRWAVILKDGGALIGDCGLAPMRVDGNATHDLGWIIHQPHWNKGYATEAALACCRLAFDHFGLDCIYANMPADHIASIRIAEKIGMSCVKQFYNPRNRNILTCLYTVTRSDSPV